MSDQNRVTNSFLERGKLLNCLPKWLFAEPVSWSSRRAVEVMIFTAALLFWPLGNLVAQSPRWVKIADDLEMAELESAPGSVLGPRLLMLRSALKRYRIEVVRATDFGWKSNNVKRLSEASKAVLVVNASFFDERGKPLGLVVSRGIVHQDLHRGGKTLTGIFQVTRSGVSIESRDGYFPRSVIEAVQSGPRLVANDKLVAGLHSNSAVSRRSGVCLDQERRVLFFCTSGIFAGTSLSALQTILQGVGCRDALNLDGGGSSQLYLSPKLPGAASDLEEVYLPGRDDIPVGIALFVMD